MPAPTFIEPPAITDYLLEVCEDTCQQIVSFQDLINRVNSFLQDMYDWLTSVSFPNILYVHDERKFYYNDGTAFQEIPDFPNVFLYFDNLLRWQDGLNIRTVPASSILHNIVWNDTTGTVQRVRETGVTEDVFPYVGCAQYQDGIGWFYHDGISWQAVAKPTANGTLILEGGEVKEYRFATQSYHVVDLPYRTGELRANGTIVERYDGTNWLEFWAEGAVRAKADDSGLDVYRSGSWQHLHTFP